MSLKLGPKRSGSVDKLVPIDPTKLFKEPTPTESRDMLDEELEVHMNNAERRYNNLLISPQRKIIEDVLLETPEGESADAAVIARKIDERFAKVTDYYIQTARNFEPMDAAYELHKNIHNPVEAFGQDITGRVVVTDYDEINGGVNPNNPESVHYHNLIYGKEELDGTPINSPDTDTIVIDSNEEDEAIDTSLFNF